MADKNSELVAISLGLEVQKASAGTWLRSFLDVEGSFMAKLDWLLSRRLLTSASSLQVYLDGVRQTNFTLQNSSPATCRLTVREDGTIVCGRASADTTIYIRCGTSEGRYILGGP